MLSRPGTYSLVSFVAALVLCPAPGLAGSPDRQQVAQLAAAYLPILLAVWGLAVAGGLLLCLALFWIVRRAYRSQVWLERSLAEHADELRDRNTTLELFLQSVAHDLRNGSVAICSLAGRLLETAPDGLGEEGKRLLRRLQTNAEHQDRILADLLTLGRVGREALAVGEVDVLLLVREVVDERLAEASGPVKVTVDGALPTLHANPHELRTVFGHLIGNALQCMGDQPAPEIEIGARDQGDRVEFAVRDNGIGIDPAYHGKIFELFERLGRAEGKGTGVGLTLVKKVVEGVGGRVWVESEPGRGATFRFTVPRVWPTRGRNGS